MKKLFLIFTFALLFGEIFAQNCSCKCKPIVGGTEYGSYLLLDTSAMTLALKHNGKVIGFTKVELVQKFKKKYYVYNNTRLIAVIDPLTRIFPSQSKYDENLF